MKLLHNKKTYFFVIFTALLLSYYQTIRVDTPNFDLKFQRHTSIISNSIEYPYQYRLLNPYAAQLWFSLSKLALPEKAGFLLAYALQNLIIYSFLIYAFSKLISLWFDETGVIVGLLMLSVIIPLSLTGYDNLGDVTTAGMMSLGFYFINTGRTKFLFPLIFFGAFNELQMILLAAFYFFGTAGHLTSGKAWLNTVLLVIMFLVAYYIIYLIRGGEAFFRNLAWLYTKDTKEMNDLQFNLTHPDFVPLWIIMIVPLLFFALKDFKIKPEFLKRSLIFVLPLFYFIAFLFIARMREIDKALTIFVILIPLALFSLVPYTKRTTPSPLERGMG